jgi:hypothetical protein
MISWLRRVIVGDSRTGAPVGPEHVPPLPHLPTRLIRSALESAVLEVVGESYRQDALNSISGGRTEYGPLRVDQVACLVPDPTNPYDPNAVAVMVEGLHVGYLSRADAVSWHPVTAWAASHGMLLAAEAAVIGGWDRGPGDQGSFGIILHIGTASETIADLMFGAIQPGLEHPWPSYLIAFTGDSVFRLSGFPLDRGACIVLAEKAGMQVHPRVTKKVQLLVDCDDSGISGNQAKATEYGIPVISEATFWTALGLPVERVPWQERNQPVSRR